MSFGQYFPRKPPKVCSDFDPREMCDERWIHSRDGSFYYDTRRKGYCCTILPGPLGVPVLLDACPFCKNALPGENARRRWDMGDKETPHPPDGTGLSGGDATAWDGELE